MILEGVSPADVPDHRPRVAMPRLIHDAGEIRTEFGRCRNVAGPRGVRPERRGIEGSGFGVILNNVDYSLDPEARHVT